MKELHSFFKPEFLNRVDEFIFFNPLSEKELKGIVQIQLKDVQNRLSEKNIQLRFKPAVINYWVHKGNDSVFGARPLKRVIQKDLLNPLSLKLISKEFLKTLRLK